MGNPTSEEVPKARVTTDRAFLDDCLKVHNDLRAKHGSPPLTMKEELCKIAQGWCNHVAQLGKMEHSTMDFGENIYYATNDPDAKTSVDKWYSEINDFDWANGEWQKGTGHFTQVIWKETTELGIAKAKGNNGYYVVGIYNPGGNMMGEYKENVLALK